MFPSTLNAGIAPASRGVLGVPGTATGGHVANTTGKVWFVSPSGVSGGGGLDPASPFSTVQAAIDEAGAGDTIWLAPGEYAEAVTISRTAAHENLTIAAAGGRGSAAIAAPTNGIALTNHADNLTLINVGLEGDGTGGGLVNTGARLRAYGCKIEGGAVSVNLTLGTVAQEAAGTHGRGADVLLSDCEICWNTRGIRLTCTDYGAVTQTLITGCRFHNLTAAHIYELVGSGGSAAVTYRNLQISDCLFDDAEGGTPPTNYLLLNANNGNDGIVARCAFPTALNGGLNLVSTALTWVSNYHTGGVSTGQPS